MKRFAWIAGSVVAVLVLAIVAVPFLIDGNLLKPELVAQAQRLTGRTVTIDGPVRFALLPAPRDRCCGSGALRRRRAEGECKCVDVCGAITTAGAPDGAREHEPPRFCTKCVSNIDGKLLGSFAQIGADARFEPTDAAARDRDRVAVRRRQLDQP